MIFISALVFLFILKLRFPKRKPINQVIYGRYGHRTLQQFRKLEKTHFKINKTKCDIYFLEHCQQYKVYPKFVQFKVSSSSFMNTGY